MVSRDPISTLRTHEVKNQPPPLDPYDPWAGDAALQEAVDREGAGWATDRCAKLSTVLGSEDVVKAGHDANKHVPELKIFDRYGHRIDEVEYHPSYHQLMGLAIEHALPSLPWSEPKPGAHVAHAALCYLFTQAETGVLCPMAMTYAVVPALWHQPDVAETWIPRVLSTEYDGRCIPASEKKGATFGMAMTEKQGGSDVRANSTRAVPEDKPGPGKPYRLTGHKWFCSAPMSDAFLTLAHTDNGLTCFLVPRFLPDGTRNNFLIQRLKNKLGNRSNASSEIEYDNTWGVMVGEEGRGVPTIIEMVHHTRLDASVAPVAMVRQALSQAIHHAQHRSAFGKRLADQPLMHNVLADLALEVEAGIALVMRVARSFDEGGKDSGAAAFSRVATAVCKYWLNKRAPGAVYEALECHGGAGYIEESIMPRLYREAPLNSIWEGSGNVICLDVLRAMKRTPDSIDAVLAEIAAGTSDHPPLADALDTIKDMLSRPADLEISARRFVEAMALALQGSLLVRNAPSAVADAFIATRLGGDGYRAYGTLPPGTDTATIIERAAPQRVS